MKKEAKSIDLSAAVKMVAVCRPTFVSYHSQFDELSSIRSKFNTNHQRTTRIEFESNPMNSKRTTIQTAASIVRDSALKVAGTMGAQQAHDNSPIEILSQPALMSGSPHAYPDDWAYWHIYWANPGP